MSFVNLIKINTSNFSSVSRREEDDFERVYWQGLVERNAHGYDAENIIDLKNNQGASTR